MRTCLQLRDEPRCEPFTAGRAQVDPIGSSDDHPVDDADVCAGG